MSITRSLDQLNKEFSVDTVKLAGVEAGATADQTAAEVPIVDSGGYYDAANVETALAELRTITEW